MAHTAYESASGECLNEVEALCKAYTSSGAFSVSTQPTLAEVEAWLTGGYRQINVALMSYGYAADQADADVMGALQHFNALWAAAQVEFSQASAGFAEGSSGRGDMFMRQFESGLTKLVQSPGFARLGASKAVNLSEYLTVGGISQSDKLIIEQDSDHVPYAFTRSKFANKGGGGSLHETRSDL